MKKKGLLWLLIIIVLVLAIGGAVGSYLWNKEPEKVEDVKSINISATELANAYAQDENAANQKYLNKALQVNGKISDIIKNQDGATVVTLAADNADLAIQCTMREKDVTVQKGTSVIIKGFCSGNTMFDVLLTDCVIK